MLKSCNYLIFFILWCKRPSIVNSFLCFYFSPGPVSETSRKSCWTRTRSPLNSNEVEQSLCRNSPASLYFKSQTRPWNTHVTNRRTHFKPPQSLSEHFPQEINSIEQVSPQKFQSICPAWGERDWGNKWFEWSAGHQTSLVCCFREFVD